MLATLGPTPRGGQWTFELKWDGVRAIVGVSGEKVRATSRNDRDITASYPELDDLPGQLGGRRLLLDGELVTLDASGAPSFGLLQQRMHVRAPTQRLLDRVPVLYYVFDVLYLDDAATTGWPQARRREALEALEIGEGPGSLPSAFGADGEAAMEFSAAHGLEGVVAKRTDSAYEPGRRSRNWIKTPINTTTEVVLGGWRPGEGRREGHIGSILLGAYRSDGRLVYIGHVGTGFTGEELRRLAGELGPLERDSSPFDVPIPREHARHAHWVEPELVGEVAYRTLTPNRPGEPRLRHPSWRGLRPDREPHEVSLPSADAKNL